MKQLVISGFLVCLLAAPAWAARTVYLKDGGVIKAKSVWRSDGKVQVLVNRDTLAEFNSEEIDMKRTFKVQKRHVRKKTLKKAAASALATNAPAPVAIQQDKNKKRTTSLPAMPSLPERSPSVFQGKEEGAIRKHKREMAEKADQ